MTTKKSNIPGKYFSSLPFGVMELLHFVQRMTLKSSSHPIIVPRFERLRSTPIIFKDKLNHYWRTFFFSFLMPLNLGKNAVPITVLALLIYWGHYYLEIERDRTTIKFTPSKFTNVQLHAVILITQLQGAFFLLCLQTKIVEISCMLLWNKQYMLETVWRQTYS